MEPGLVGNTANFQGRAQTLRVTWWGPRARAKHLDGPGFVLAVCWLRFHGNSTRQPLGKTLQSGQHEVARAASGRAAGLLFAAGSARFDTSRHEQGGWWGRTSSRPAGLQTLLPVPGNTEHLPEPSMLTLGGTPPSQEGGREGLEEQERPQKGRKNMWMGTGKQTLDFTSFSRYPLTMF